RPPAVRVRVSDEALGAHDGAVVERDLDAAAEGSPRGIGLVIARGPGGVLDRADLAPERDRRGAMRALRAVGVDVMPPAVLEGDREDVHHRVVESLPRGVGVVLLWIVRAGPDDG